MKEVEKKMLLKPKEFQRYQNYFMRNFKRHFTVNKNYYFDTIDLDLLKNDVTCRVRELNETYTLTVKSKEKDGFACVSKEKNELINSEMFEKLCDGKIKISDLGECCNHIVNLELINYGSLYTCRDSYYIDDCTICLDQNSYHDVTDYEIEIEGKTIEKIEKVYNSFFSDLKYDSSNMCGKRKRFFSHRDTFEY